MRGVSLCYRPIMSAVLEDQQDSDETDPQLVSRGVGSDAGESAADHDSVVSREDDRDRGRQAKMIVDGVAERTRGRYGEVANPQTTSPDDPTLVQGDLRNTSFLRLEVQGVADNAGSGVVAPTNTAFNSPQKGVWVDEQGGGDVGQRLSGAAGGPPPPLPPPGPPSGPMKKLQYSAGPFVDVSSRYSAGHSASQAHSALHDEQDASMIEGGCSSSTRQDSTSNGAASRASRGRRSARDEQASQALMREWRSVKQNSYAAAYERRKSARSSSEDRGLQFSLDPSLPSRPRGGSVGPLSSRGGSTTDRDPRGGPAAATPRKAAGRMRRGYQPESTVEIQPTRSARGRGGGTGGGPPHRPSGGGPDPNFMRPTISHAHKSPYKSQELWGEPSVPLPAEQSSPRDAAQEDLVAPVPGDQQETAPDERNDHPPVKEFPPKYVQKKRFPCATAPGGPGGPTSDGIPPRPPPTPGPAAPPGTRSSAESGRPEEVTNSAELRQYRYDLKEGALQRPSSRSTEQAKAAAAREGRLRDVTSREGGPGAVPQNPSPKTAGGPSLRIGNFIIPRLSLPHSGIV